jgi:single-strand DNA-binding protein
MSTTITTEGNLVTDPELRWTKAGKAVCTIRVAVTARRKNAEGEYEDTPAQFYDGVCWGPLAEHVADSALHKGHRVLIHGSAYDQEWTDREGNTRVKHVIQVQAVGVSLRYATATVHRANGTSVAEAADQLADAEVAEPA